MSRIKRGKVTRARHKRLLKKIECWNAFSGKRFSRNISSEVSMTIFERYFRKGSTNFGIIKPKLKISDKSADNESDWNYSL